MGGPPQKSSLRGARQEKWTLGGRGFGTCRGVEQVIAQLKDLCALERHRAKAPGGLLARLAAKVAAFTTGEWLTMHLGHPLRHLADLLV